MNNLCCTLDTRISCTPCGGVWCTTCWKSIGVTDHQPSTSRGQDVSHTDTWRCSISNEYVCFDFRSQDQVIFRVCPHRS